MIESKTAYKIGYGSDWFRSVKGLSKKEKKEIQSASNGAGVWFYDGGHASFTFGVYSL